MKNLKYLCLGVLFGFIIAKAEIISWSRIQEMLQFQDFHVPAILISAIVMGCLTYKILNR